MSKIESWGDLFKYNKELLEDDFNHGQGLVLKTKTKASDNVTVSWRGGNGDSIIIIS
jgi:hypothetical protein